MDIELRVMKYKISLAALSVTAGGDFWEWGMNSSMKAQKHEWY